MNKILLASTALIMSAGFAAADVSVGGDGRMGVISGFSDDADLRFTSRIRISFSASGETDGGLAFGGSVRADNAGGFTIRDQDGNAIGDDNFNPTTTSDLNLDAGGGVAGRSGTVFIEGGFGKLSMGDVDGAAKSAVGHVSGVGLTGLGDLNEMKYVANVGGTTPGALYENSFGDFAVYVSASNPGTATGAEADVAYALGGSYSFGNFTVALGYEDNDGTDQVIGGVTAAFGDFTAKATVGSQDAGEQYALSGDYTFGATTVTAYYADSEDVGGQEAFGLGASYDLGGGASLKGGYASNESNGNDAYDLGVSFSF